MLVSSGQEAEFGTKDLYKDRTGAALRSQGGLPKSSHGHQSSSQLRVSTERINSHFLGMYLDDELGVEDSFGLESSILT
jgi:hypothetical protein